jgi:hypothetical protein
METKEKATISRQILYREDKDSNFTAQYKRVRLSFSERPKTMLEVSIETGILRANICRYVRAMESKGEKYSASAKAIVPFRTIKRAFIRLWRII